MNLNHPILLTNDDGYNAPGIKTLWDCLKGMGLTNVKMAAPARGWSVRSHACTVGPEEWIQVSPLTLDGMRGVVVGGFPADCSRVGLRALDLFDGEKPLVIAGINGGANLGIDAFYSGTLAAAREAVALGYPAIALSLITGRNRIQNWERTSRWAARLLAWLIPIALEKSGCVWNVNFPSQPDSEEFPSVRLVPMSTDPLPVTFTEHNEVKSQYLYSGPYHSRAACPGSDVEALFNGSITVTPMMLDLTDYGMLKEISVFKENAHGR